MLTSALQVAQIEGIDYTLSDLPFGSQRYLDTGIIIEDEEIDDLRVNYDCVLLGALGDPRCPVTCCMRTPLN